MKKKMYAFYLPVETKKKIKELADREGINMSYLLRNLVDKEWDERGYSEMREDSTSNEAVPR